MVSLDRPPHFVDEKPEASETILGNLYSITGFHQACILVLNNIGHRMWVSPENLLFTQKQNPNSPQLVCAMPLDGPLHHGAAVQPEKSPQLCPRFWTRLCPSLSLLGAALPQPSSSFHLLWHCHHTHNCFTRLHTTRQTAENCGRP